MSDPIRLGITRPSRQNISLTVNRISQEHPDHSTDTTSPGGDSLIYLQNAASSEWLVSHSFSYPPVVVIIDSAGSQVYGSIEYLSPTLVKITFSSPFSGRAILS